MFASTQQTIKAQLPADAMPCCASLGRTAGMQLTCLSLCLRIHQYLDPDAIKADRGISLSPDEDQKHTLSHCAFGIIAFHWCRCCSQECHCTSQSADCLTAYCLMLQVKCTSKFPGQSVSRIFRVYKVSTTAKKPRRHSWNSRVACPKTSLSWYW